MTLDITTVMLEQTGMLDFLRQRYLNQSDEPLLFFGDNGALLGCNQAFAEMLGYRCEHLQGLTLSDILLKPAPQPQLATLPEPIFLTFAHIDGQNHLHCYGEVAHSNPEDLPSSGWIKLIHPQPHIPQRQASVLNDYLNDNRLYQILFENSADGMVLFNLQQQCEHANAAFYQLLGYDSQDLSTVSYSDLTPNESHDISARMFKQAFESSHSEIVETDFIHHQGHRLTISVQANAIYDQLGNVIGYWAVYRDISADLRILERLSQDQRLLEQTSKLAKLGGWEFEHHNDQMYLSREAYRILGLPQSPHTDIQSLLCHFSDSASQTIRSSIEVALIFNTPFELEVEYQGYKLPRWLRITGRVRFNDDGGKMVIGSVQDITEIKNATVQAGETLHDKPSPSLLDPLTQLPTRLLFHDRLSQAIYRAHRSDDGQLGLVLIDLDQFERLNDAFGIELGDQYLKQLAHNLKARIRKSDTLARLGGNEFAVLLEKCDRDSCHRLLQHLLSTTILTQQISGKTLSCTLSIGVALFPDHGASASTLYQQVNGALTNAKQQNGNSLCFASEISKSNL